MSHEHSHRSANTTRLAIALAITATVLVVEIVGAAISGSLALLADAGHMGSDVLALIIALLASAVAARPPTDRQTFGFQRAEVLGALANGLLLTGVAVFIAIEGIRRLLEPGRAEVAAVPMLVAAAIGLIANVAALLVLRGGVSTSINLRGAYLEVLGDALGSVAAIVAGAVMLLTGFVQADAIASLVIAALIVPRALSLLRDVIRVLSESAPRGTSVAEIREHLLAADGVVGVHDVHVWAITSGAPVFTAHVIVDPAVFAQGKAYSYITYNFFRPKVDDASASQVVGKADIIAVPGKEAGKGASLNGAWGWAIPKSSNNPDAAWQFIKWVESKDIAVKRAERVLKEGGELSRGEILRLRLRHMTDGVVLGSKAFVNEMFALHREKFGAKRQTGARPIRGVALEGLSVLRDLRVRAVT